jgi:NAD+ synthase
MTKTSLRLALAQLNPIVGDVAGNAEKVRAARREAAARAPSSSMLPELFLSGLSAGGPRAASPAFADCLPHGRRAARREILPTAGPAVLVGTGLA